MKSVLAALVVVVTPVAARAHRGSISYGSIKLDEEAVFYELQIPAADLAEALGLAPDEVPTKDQLRAGRERIAGYVGRRIAVLDPDRECRPEPASFALVDEAGTHAVRLALRYQCGRRLQKIEVRYQLFFDIDERHESFTTVERERTLVQHVFRRSDRTLRIDRPASAWRNIQDYFVLGMEHILTGYDHILFLIGLLLVAGRDGRTGERRGLRKGFVYTLEIVTAFTVAHSITLIAAALGAVSLPGQFVESAIAASIAYVGIENMAVREPRHRWALTFLFGLIHGFGFAGILNEIGLPTHGLISSLVSFNVGVEVGQAAIVVVTFPVLHYWAGMKSYRPIILIGGSAVTVLFALLWLVERSFGIEILSRMFG